MFQLVTNILEKKEKARFVEKVRFICQLIEASARLHQFETTTVSINKEQAFIELQEMGIIQSIDDLPFLKKFIAKEYSDLLQALTIYHQQKASWGRILQRFSKDYRQEQSQAHAERSLPTYADFFAGAGGLSLGFAQAGFGIELVNEIEPLAVETYKYNHPEVASEKIVTADIKDIVNDIEHFIGNQYIDVVIGGPPCQSFSSANQQRMIDDPRNELYKYFIQAVEKIKPKFVVMENVVGMKKVADQVIEDFHSIQVNVNGSTVSYDVDFHIFNSEDFSVAQRRQRLFYIAVRDDVANNKQITPQQIIDEIISSCMLNNRFILSDALQYLRPLEASKIKGKNEIDSIEAGFKVDINPFVEQYNPYLTMINQGNTSDYIFNHKARFLNDTNYEVYRLLDQGDDATNEKVAHVMPYGHRNHLFKDKYFKLIEDRPSRTITAHLTMDGHSHIHPTQVRSLTPREAARIQSFPDDFVFFGPYLKTFTQIGNAVPPLMAKGIAEVIKKYLK